MSRHNSIFTILTRTASDYQIKQLKIPKEQKWAGMELTTIGDLMIVANACKKSKPVKTEFMRMMALDLSSMKINPVCQRDFSSTNFSSVQFMRKIKGYDFFIVACKGSLGIVEFRNKEFTVLKFFENLYTNYIFEVAIFGNFMLPVSMSDEPLKVIEFDCEPQLNGTANYSTKKSALSITRDKAGPISMTLESKKHGIGSTHTHGEIDYQTINDTYAHLNQILEFNPTVRKFQTPYLSKPKRRIK